MKKVLFSLMVCAGFAACTSDDVVASLGDSSGYSAGDVAYLTVNIKNVDSGTRGTSAGNTTGTSWEAPYANGFTYGEEGEYAVNNAHFYFYDANGVFVSRAEVWDGNTTVTEPDPEERESYGSVTLTSNPVIVLRGLEEVVFPLYMVTVINESGENSVGEYQSVPNLDFLAETTAVAGTDANTDANGNAYGNDTKTEGITNGKGFVMTTSAYSSTTLDKAHDTSSTDSNGDAIQQARPYYFVTEIGKDNFQAEPVTNVENNPYTVDVYVERLASKVGVKTASGVLTSETTSFGQSVNYVLMELSVGGSANDSNDQAGNEYEGTTPIYVDIQGWTLNATPRETKLMKDMQDCSNWGAFTFVWNAENNYRSYWAEGTAYGVKDFPTTAVKEGNTAGNTDADETDTDSSKWLNEYLLYTSLDETTRSLQTIDVKSSSSSTETTNHYLYCGENTNTAAALGTKNSSGITSVLIKAQAMQKTTEDETTSYTPIDLVHYEDGGGVSYWTVNGFKDRMVATEINYDFHGGFDTVLEEALGTGTLASAAAEVVTSLLNDFDGEVYVKKSSTDVEAGEDDADYELYDGRFIYLVNLGDGHIGVWVNNSPAEWGGDESGKYPGQTLYNTWEPLAIESTQDLNLDNYDIYLKAKEGMESAISTAIAVGEGTGALLNYGISNWSDNFDATTGYLKLSTDALIISGAGHTYDLRNFFIRAIEKEADATNTYFADLSTGDPSKPNFYNNGLMYYSIPIEHLGTQTGESLAEGDYGIVRNHWYDITINSISHLGKGITDEEEVIVPDPEAPTYYYVDASINVNSWNIITQSADL